MSSSGLEKDKKMEDNIIKDIRNLLRLEREIKKKKEIDYTNIRDIKNLFEHVIYGIAIIFIMKVMVIETKHYQLKNISAKLNLTLLKRHHN